MKLRGEQVPGLWTTPWKLDFVSKMDARHCKGSEGALYKGDSRGSGGEVGLEGKKTNLKSWTKSGEKLLQN